MAATLMGDETQVASDQLIGEANPIVVCIG